MKILAISDTHIGHEHANVEAIQRFLDKVDSTTDVLVLNGDILDLWRMNYSDIYLENADLLERFSTIAEDIPTIWILGNHDYTTPQKEFPNIVFRSSVDIDGFHFEHGHRFDMQQVQYTWAYKLIPTLYPPLHQAFFKSPAEDKPTTDQGSRILPMHRRAIIYAYTHDVNVVIGHSHMPQIKEVGDINWMVDCGDFVDSCTYIQISNSVPTLISTKTKGL